MVKDGFSSCLCRISKPTRRFTFMEISVKEENIETDESAEVAECSQPSSSSPSKPKTQKPKKRNI